VTTAAEEAAQAEKEEIGSNSRERE